MALAPVCQIQTPAQTFDPRYYIDHASCSGAYDLEPVGSTTFTVTKINR